MVPLGIPHSEFLSWSEDDQDKALAFQRAQLEICSTCGTREAEWEADRFAYVGEAVRCPGCEVLEMERDNVPENAKGVHLRLKKNLPDDLMEEEEDW